MKTDLKKTDKGQIQIDRPDKAAGWKLNPSQISILVRKRAEKCNIQIHGTPYAYEEPMSDITVNGVQMTPDNADELTEDINAAAGGGGGAIPDDWSFDEKDTGTTFLDGKKIYRKTIDLGALPNNSMKTVVHGIENIDMVTGLSGITYDYISFLNIPHASTTAGSSISCYADRVNIKVTTASDRTSFAVTYVTVKYTCTNR
jgi:hypothetical protein